MKSEKRIKIKILNVLFPNFCVFLSRTFTGTQNNIARREGVEEAMKRRRYKGGETSVEGFVRCNEEGYAEKRTREGRESERAKRQKESENIRAIVREESGTARVCVCRRGFAVTRRGPRTLSERKGEWGEKRERERD